MSKKQKDAVQRTIVHSYLMDVDRGDISFKGGNTDQTRL